MSEVELVNVTRLNDNPGTGPPDRLEGSSINGDLLHDHEATTELVYHDREGSGAPEVSVHYSKSAHSPKHDEECDGEADRLLHKVRYTTIVEVCSSGTSMYVLKIVVLHY